MDDVRKCIAEVLQEGHILTVATSDSKGVWTAPMVFIADVDLSLYWISLPDSRHSRAIADNPSVAATMVASWQHGQERAVQISGIAEQVSNVSFDLEKRFAAKRNEPIPERAGDILNYRGKRHAWYRLRPAFFKLIHSESFPHERKDFTV